MKWNLAAAAGAAVMMVFITPVAQADSISSVENARAKDRAGYYLSRQDREKLRRYGRGEEHRAAHGSRRHFPGGLPWPRTPVRMRKSDAVVVT